MFVVVLLPDSSEKSAVIITMAHCPCLSLILVAHLGLLRWPIEVVMNLYRRRAPSSLTHRVVVASRARTAGCLFQLSRGRDATARSGLADAGPSHRCLAKAEAPPA